MGGPGQIGKRCHPRARRPGGWRGGSQPVCPPPVPRRASPNPARPSCPEPQQASSVTAHTGQRPREGGEQDGVLSRGPRSLTTVVLSLDVLIWVSALHSSWKLFLQGLGHTEKNAVQPVSWCVIIQNSSHPCLVCTFHLRYPHGVLSPWGMPLDVPLCLVLSMPTHPKDAGLTPVLWAWSLLQESGEGAGEGGRGGGAWAQGEVWRAH